MLIKPFNPVKNHTAKTFGQNSLYYPNSYLQIKGEEVQLLHTPVGDNFLGENVKLKAKDNPNNEEFIQLNTLLGKVLGAKINKKSRSLELIGEDESKKVNLNPQKAVLNAIKAGKRECAQPPLRIITKGTAQGKAVFYVDDKAFKNSLRDDLINEPIVAIIDSQTSSSSSFYGYEQPTHPLVKGIIFANRDEGLLCHDLAQVRNTTEVAAMCYDRKTINKFKKLNGKTIELNVSHEGLNVKEIPPEFISQKTQQKRIIKIRDMHSEAKLLLPEELNLDNAGPKACNLAHLKKMAENGKLKDVKIPPFFVIPVGIFDSILEANPETSEIFKNHVKKFEDNLDYKTAQSISRNTSNLLGDMTTGYILKKISPTGYEKYNELKNMIEEYIPKIVESPKDQLIIRSSFNGEDTPHYSAAGIYSSKDYCDQNGRDVLYRISDVWDSQYQMPAYLSRKENGIPESAIKPCMIVQKQVIPDYSFTVYTNDIVDSDCLFIEAKTCPKTYEDIFRMTADSNLIKYNKKTGKLSLIAKERFNEPVITDLQGNVVVSTPQKSEIVDNFKDWEATFKQLAKICLTIADELGAPQDIEGGIKTEVNENGESVRQIYLWQTRNIVK